MGEILGLGLTHYPGLTGPDSNFAAPLRFVLSNPALPDQYRSPEGWPEPMRREWGDDEGLAAAKRHREALAGGLRKVREMLDAFQPDFVLIWGDDQYENFQEEIIPPFCVLAYDSLEVQPWSRAGMTGSSFWGEHQNYWNEPKDKTFHVQGHQAAAKYLTAHLLQQGFDIPYAYKPFHKPFGHAFLNTFLYLDYDRKGFSYPVIPFQVNCYGRRVIAQHGSLMSIGDSSEAEGDPPSPMPWRCFDLGAGIARALVESPYRAALIASSSWSHGTLTAKNWFIHPDVESDRQMFQALKDGDYAKWRERPLAAVEECGQQELLNWFCLVGAMAELGRKPQDATFVESWIFNSSKCFAFFPPS